MRVLGLGAPEAPVLIASAGLAARWPGIGKGPAGLVSKRKVGREDVIVMKGMSPATIVRTGDTIVVASIMTPLRASPLEDPRLGLGAFGVGLVETWRRSRIHGRMNGDLVIFSDGNPADAVPVTAPPGDLPLYLGVGRREVRLFPNHSVSLEFRAVSLGTRPPGAHDRPPDDPAPPIVPTKAQLRDATRAEFVNANFGHMIVLPASLVASWEGAPSVHEKGPRPFRDAQRVRSAGLITVEQRVAVVMEPHSAVGLCPRPDGLLLVVWRDATDETAAVIAAMSAAEDRWRPLGTLHALERDVVMFDSGVAGRKLDAWDRVEGTLPETGAYEVTHLPRYAARVEVEGKIEHAHVTAVRLRRA